jgi:hypothetical protein
MIESADLSVSMSRAGGKSRKVVGKPLLVVSAVGMVLVIAMLCHGNWMQAIAAFLLTLGALEIMLQRALSQFDAAATAPAVRRRRLGRNAVRPATVGD